MEISIKRTPKNSKNSAEITTQELLDLINAASFMSEALDERITLIGRIFEDEISKVNTKIDNLPSSSSILNLSAGFSPSRSESSHSDIVLSPLD